MEYYDYVDVEFADAPQGEPGSGVLAYESPEESFSFRYDFESVDERYGHAEKVKAFMDWLKCQSVSAVKYGER